MKHLKVISTILFLVIMMSLQSCSSDDDSSSNSGSSDLFINFTLNGSDIAISGDTEVISAFSGDGFNILSINGSSGTIGNSDFARISLQIPDRTVNSGTHNFSADISERNEYRCSIITSASELLGSGSITITSNDGNEITGTFSGNSFEPNGTISQEITNGSFRAISNPN